MRALSQLQGNFIDISIGKYTHDSDLESLPAMKPIKIMQNKKVRIYSLWKLTSPNIRRKQDRRSTMGSSYFNQKENKTRAVFSQTENTILSRSVDTTCQNRTPKTNRQIHSTDKKPENKQRDTKYYMPPSDLLINSRRKFQNRALFTTAAIMNEK